mgnify:CR=1 FL=1
MRTSRLVTKGPIFYIHRIHRENSNGQKAGGGKKLPTGKDQKTWTVGNLMIRYR